MVKRISARSGRAAFIRGRALCFFFFAIAVSICGSAQCCVVDLNCEVDPSFPLKFNCSVAITNYPNLALISVTYRATEIIGGPILRVTLSMEPETFTTFSLYRLAPGNEYEVTAIVDDPSLSCGAITTAVTGLTGDEEMDNGPLVAMERTQDSTLDLIVYDRQAKYVAFDRTGWAVWFLDTGSVMPPQAAFAKFQHPDYTVSALMNSTVARFTPDNQLIMQHVFPCDPNLLSMINHECFAPEDNPYGVYVFQQMVAPGVYDDEGNVVVDQVISSWDAKNNNLTHICPTTDIYDPYTQRGPMSTATLSLTCPGTIVRDDLESTDWSHDNALSLANDPSKLIMSSRHLSAIAEIDRNTCGLSWFVSTEISGGYTVPKEEDRWYNQHYAHQLANGNFLMLDNGNDRPDQALGSRALEIEIDHESGTARAVWQWAPGLTTKHAGVVADLEGGRTRLVAFSCDVIAARYDCDMLLWEVEIESGEVVTSANIPRSAADSIGAYRAEVWETINGEVVVG